MVASYDTVDAIIKVFLKYVDKKTAIRMARDLYNHVHGNKSVTDTFLRIVERLLEEEGR
jgi:hypothetical protein